MSELRKEFDPPEAVNKWGWKYHHLGIPTKKRMRNEKFIQEYKMYVAGFETSPFGIEWMRFEEDSPISNLIKSVPHVAFEVEDLDYELANRNLKILSPPVNTMNGIRIAMVVHREAPIELIEFNNESQS